MLYVLYIVDHFEASFSLRSRLPGLLTQPTMVSTVAGVSTVIGLLALVLGVALTMRCCVRRKFSLTMRKFLIILNLSNGDK